jgi:uncharacterized protein
MPKKSKPPEPPAPSKTVATKSNSSSSSEAVYECPTGIRICIDAKPGAKQNSVVRIEDGAVTVQIAARAVDGAANAELIEYIAEVIGTRRQTLSIISGQTCRQKVLFLSPQSAMSATEVLSKFTGAIE